MNRVASVLLFTAVWCGVVPPGSAQPPTYTEDEARAILDPWTGSWEGTFKVYGQDGRLQTTLEVQQTYRWDGDIQVARFVETAADGTVTTADARNYRDEQGRLVCEVEKSNGESSTHFGTFTDGTLFWHADTPIRVESFRERVVTDEHGQRSYDIDGFGGYGSTERRNYFVFAGSYREVIPDE
ncbi:MAG: hypothetical protein AAF911_05805 [Planctomycetota bacterium]